MNIRFMRPGPVHPPRPYLPVRVINPESAKELRVYALIDTGADECAFPASFASLLWHNLQGGQTRKISTGNGVTIAYGHTTRIAIEGFTTQDVLVDFMPNLNTPLLGEEFSQQFHPDSGLSKQDIFITTRLGACRTAPFLLEPGTLEPSTQYIAPSTQYRAQRLRTLNLESGILNFEPDPGNPCGNPPRKSKRFTFLPASPFPFHPSPSP